MNKTVIKTDYRYGFSKPENYVFKSKKGLDKSVVNQISAFKKEPLWMLEQRLSALSIFESKKMPQWGADLSEINFDDIYYYIRPTDRQATSWDDLPKDIKDTYDAIGIPEAERKLLAGVTAQYECIAGDTLVFGNPSLTPIKDMKKGKYVYALNEETKQLEKQKVLGLDHKGRRPVFKIKVAGRTIKCTFSHPFLALKYNRELGRKRGKFHTEWEYLRNLNVGDFIAVTKDIPDNGKPFGLPAVSFVKEYVGRNQLGSFPVKANYLFTRSQKKLSIPKTSTDDLLWLIGLYLGDGFITGKSLQIAIPKVQKELRSKVQKVFWSVFKYRLSDQNDLWRIRVQSVPIIELFTKLGLRGKAKTKSLPDWIFGLPKSQKLALIGGYIDSDGYLRNSKKNSDVWITSVNYKLLEQFHMLGLSCGLHVTGIHRFKYFIKDREAIGYRLQITGDITPLIQYSLKAKNFIPRKFYHTFGTCNGSPLKKHISDQFGFARIQSIEPDGEDDVYDIEVEGHHNFIANGILVHNSESVYHSFQKKWEDMGVIFCDMDTGLRKYPELVKQYFGKSIPAADNKFAALNSAVWSGGSFIYVPPGVSVDIPLQAYFRINAANMGQFERTLIIVDEGAYVHYVEGCTAPVYTTDSLHAAVVEIFVKKGARCRYTTIQNWSNNVYNLVTKRAFVEEEGIMEWVDGNLGSKITMKYPSCYLVGRKARGEILSLAYAGKGQQQDAGGKLVFLAPETSGEIVSKSVSAYGGRTSYRGLVKIIKNAKGVKANVRCDALILDQNSRSDTYPTMKVDEDEVSISHEATVSKVGEQQLFYLMSRGLTEMEATSLIVNGFVEPIVKELPLEYAVELNRLIQLNMEGAVG